MKIQHIFSKYTLNCMIRWSRPRNHIGVSGAACAAGVFFTPPPAEEFSSITAEPAAVFF
jgi:hypothetical protein